ncbi:MAG: hypothetical protein ACTHJ8_10195 [Mucilaginibacter sp.]
MIIITMLLIQNRRLHSLYRHVRTGCFNRYVKRSVGLMPLGISPTEKTTG